MLAWFVSTGATAVVLLHVGIKFPGFVFIHKDSCLRPSDPPENMRAAIDRRLLPGCWKQFVRPVVSAFDELSTFLAASIPRRGARVFLAAQGRW